MTSGQGLTYSVDLVLVIDLTASMRPVLEQVKTHSLTFHEDMRAALAEKGKEIDTLRVRIIGYRDYFYDGDASMMETDFFNLPDETSAFAEVVKSLHHQGGGDEPESGLEAVALAIRSPWNSAGDKQRQVIAVWTDASTHPLEKGSTARPSGYPADLPKTFDELTDDWEGQTYMSGTAKRLLLFAPDARFWSDIEENWNNTVQLASQAGSGMRDVDYSAILDTIANSV